MSIFERLKNRYNFPDDQDQFVRDCISRCRANGFNEIEVYSYVRWTEHVDPLISEKTALLKMRRITDKVVADGRYTGKLPKTWKNV